MIDFILLKPEAIQRNLIGKIICFIENKGLKIVGLKMLCATKEQVEQLYKEHVNSPHYHDLINLCLDGPVVAIAIEHNPYDECSENSKKMQGKYDTAGTIRFYFSSHPSRGVLHCSSSDEGIREATIFFSESEINDYIKVLDEWVFAKPVNIV